MGETTTSAPCIQLVSITKRFPGVTASRDVSLTVESGTFHAIVGENGAGKSTILNMLYGRFQPDEGQIFLEGNDVTRLLNNPSDSIRRGVGLVSQHYSLIPALTVFENIILGMEPVNAFGILSHGAAEKKIKELASQLGIQDIPLNQRAERLSVAAGQKVEILKALYRGARILLLDEPTATLAPQEADSLFALLKTLLQNGTSIIFVTHKLREVIEYSQRVTVLRAGANAGDFITSKTNKHELLVHIIGARDVASPGHRTPLAGFDADSNIGPLPERVPKTARSVLQIKDVTVKDARGAEVVQMANLEISEGEIVGVAGVDGSGQKELAEAMVGLRSLSSGKLLLTDWQANMPRNIAHLSVRERQRSGIAYIPEDRHKVGMILNFSIAENYLIGHEDDPQWGGGAILQPDKMSKRAEGMIQSYDVRVGERDSTTYARNLSGGNQQKVVVARAMDSDPRLLIACQPTRGLDVEAARFVYSTLGKARGRGIGILLFSLDLDEILELSDRIAVMYNRKIVAVLPRSEATPEKLGELMTGSSHPEEVSRT